MPCQSFLNLFSRWALSMKEESADVPMPITARVFGYGAVTAHARTQVHQPVSPCTTPLTHLFDRSEMESRVLAVVAVIGEQTEGEIGSRLFG